MQRFWDSFNSAQSQAITAPLCHMVINAAAGTGKTSTLAARILFLQTHLDIPPSSIMAISFSRTARSRLVEKLTSFCKHLGTGSPVPTYTFHGLAFRVVRFATSLGETWLKPGFELLDSSILGNRLFLQHQDFLLQGVGKGLDKESALSAFIKTIDELRQGTVDMEPYLTPNELDPNVYIEVDIGLNTLIRITSRDVITVWRRYENLLKKHNAIDYTGLIIEAIKVLSHPQGEARKRVCDGLKAILVDEYQDTSKAQEKLLFKLAGDNIPITVVGDTDQTIYTFNGSSISNMNNFQCIACQTNIQVLPPIQMVENYRSTSPILETANRVRKNLTQERLLVPAEDILDDRLSSYRERNLPVRLVHAPRLELAADYVAQEIKRLVNDEGLSESEIAVLVRKNSEYSPQGEAVKEALSKYGMDIILTSEPSDINRRNHLRFVYEFCQDPENYGRLLNELISDGSNLSLPEDLPFEKFTFYIQEAIQAGAQYCYEAIEMLYDNMNLEETNEGNSGIQIRTIHSAKGEEFRAVFLMYLGDRSFPHGSRPDLEEERRLLYVGITRAQERLYILGRPGIHQEDFFGDCLGPNSIQEEHFVPGGNAENNLEIEVDNGFITLVDQARSKQKEKEQEEREKLWRMFEEDF